MNTITDFYAQAELALAAYANLTSGISSTAYTNALTDDAVGMTLTQANAFASKWNVVTQYTDPVTGVSATVFQAKEGGPKYLAIRGTGGLDDIGTDIDLAVGLPMELNLQYIALLYNAPGVNGLAGGVTTWILDKFGITAPVDPSKISNIKADAGTSPIAGLGAQVAPAVTIHIEDQFFSDVSNPPGSYNHSQRVLTDSLALYATYAQVDSTANDAGNDEAWKEAA